jgi:hypothetical protein
LLGLLKDKTKADDITATLDEFKKLPSDLNESVSREKLMLVYSKAVDQINLRTLKDRRLAQAVFTWLTFAQTSFTTVQLRNAFAIKIGTSSSNVHERDLHSIDEILSACAGLVRVDRENDTIGFIHSTAKDFFQVQLCTIDTKSTGSSIENSRGSQDVDMSLMEAHRQLAMACVTYLNFDEFRTGPCRTERELIQRFEDYPLYKYAAENWGTHAKHIIDCFDSSDSKILFSFLQDRLKVGAASQAQNYNKSGSHNLVYFNTTQQIIPKYSSALHVATSFRLTSIVKTLLEKGQDPNAVDELSMTPLCQAAAVGDVGIVELLLSDQYRANPAHNSYDGTPLVLAAANGHEKVVKVLLTKDIESKGLALIMASNKGHQAVIMQLLEAGVDPNESGINPVNLARQNENKGMENLLVEYGATRPELMVSQVARMAQHRALDVHKKGQIHNEHLQLYRNGGMTPENKDRTLGHEAAVVPSFQNQRTITFPLQDQTAPWPSIPPPNTAKFPVQNPAAAWPPFQPQHTVEFPVHQAAAEHPLDYRRPRAELKADSVVNGRGLGASAASRLRERKKPSSVKELATKLEGANRAIATLRRPIQRQSPVEHPNQRQTTTAHLPQHRQVEAHTTPNHISTRSANHISRQPANGQSRMGANGNNHANNYGNGSMAQHESQYPNAAWPSSQHGAGNGYETQSAHVKPQIRSSHTRGSPRVNPAHINPAHVKPPHAKPPHVKPPHVKPTHVKPTHVKPTHISTFVNGTHGKKGKAHGKKDDSDGDGDTESDADTDIDSESDDPDSDSEDDSDSDKPKLLKNSKEKDSHDGDDDSDEAEDDNDDDDDSDDDDDADDSSDDDDDDDSSDDGEETLAGRYGVYLRNHDEEDSSDDDEGVPANYHEIHPQDHDSDNSNDSGHEHSDGELHCGLLHHDHAHDDDSEEEGNYEHVS